MHRTMLRALIVVAALLLAACGSSGGTAATSSSSSAAGSPGSSSSSAAASGASSSSPSSPSSSSSASGADVCSYATNDEVAAAIGEAISLSKQESDTQCGYFPDTSATSNGFYVEVSDGAAYDALKQTLVRQEPVTGLGDDAFWTAPTLRVKAGAKMIVIIVDDVRWNGGDSKGAAVAVAQKVLTRI